MVKDMNTEMAQLASKIRTYLYDEVMHGAALLGYCIIVSELHYING